MFIGLLAVLGTPSPAPAEPDDFRLTLDRADERRARRTRRLDQPCQITPMVADAPMPAIRRAKPPQRPQQIEGYAHQHIERNPPNFRFGALGYDTAQQVCSLRFVGSGSHPGTGNPRKGKTLKARPIGRFFEFSRRAESFYEFLRRAPFRVCPRPAPIATRPLSLADVAHIEATADCDFHCGVQESDSRRGARGVPISNATTLTDLRNRSPKPR
jgi:hypothetical protein